MAHLGQIQQLLNTNPAYRSRFIRDPVAALAEQGLILSIEMQMKLRQMVASAARQPPAVPGSSVGQAGNKVLQTTPLSPSSQVLQTTPLAPGSAVLQTTPLSTGRQIPLIITI
jgi:hypothetical protein